MNGYAAAYFHWHRRRGDGMSFDPSNDYCRRNCFETFARLQWDWDWDFG